MGAAFAHKNGKGVTLLINGKRYSAFSPKAKTAEPAGRARKRSSFFFHDEKTHAKTL